MSLAFYDGQFVDSASIMISPTDFGFCRGVAIYEFTRIYAGVPFHLDDHLDRLIQSAEVAGIPWTYTKQDIIQAVQTLVAQNKFTQSTVKFFLTMGECEKTDGFGFVSYANFKPHFIAIEDEVFPKHPDAPKGLTLHERGLNLKAVPFSRELSMMKSINYLPGFRAARQLAGTDFDEILYTHRDGYVTETTASNFFCVIDDVLCTPRREMLKGVTRKVLLELAGRLGLPTDERDTMLPDLRHASEAFITGSFIEMCPIRRVDDIIFAATTTAPIYARLRKGFSDYIADYCRKASIRTA